MNVASVNRLFGVTLDAFYCSFQFSLHHFAYQHVHLYCDWNLNIMFDSLWCWSQRQSCSVVHWTQPITKSEWVASALSRCQQRQRWSQMLTPWSFVFNEYNEDDLLREWEIFMEWRMLETYVLLLLNLNIFLFCIHSFVTIFLEFMYCYSHTPLWLLLLCWALHPLHFLTLCKWIEGDAIAQLHTAKLRLTLSAPVNGE